ncbi:hypothetical protein BN871_BM_00600 [Paenibacillus sp. P22]|nr:hypothetical protein BN871_BM_00600 [Paenibacillus sp. P22]
MAERNLSYPVLQPSRPSFTPQLHAPASRSSFTLQLHAPASRSSFTLQLHAPASRPSFTLQHLAPASHHLLAPAFHRLPSFSCLRPDCRQEILQPALEQLRLVEQQAVPALLEPIGGRSGQSGRELFGGGSRDNAVVNAVKDGGRQPCEPVQLSAQILGQRRLGPRDGSGQRGFQPERGEPAHEFGAVVAVKHLFGIPGHHSRTVGLGFVDQILRLSRIQAMGPLGAPGKGDGGGDKGESGQLLLAVADRIPDRGSSSGGEAGQHKSFKAERLSDIFQIVSGLVMGITVPCGVRTAEASQIRSDASIAESGQPRQLRIEDPMVQRPSVHQQQGNACGGAGDMDIEGGAVPGFNIRHAGPPLDQIRLD